MPYMVPNPDTEAGGLVKHPMYDGPGGKDLEASHAFASERDKMFYQGKGTEGQDIPQDSDWHGKREGRPQKPPAGGDTTWREWAERTKGSRAEMDAGIQHPGHTLPRVLPPPYKKAPSQPRGNFGKWGKWGKNPSK